MQLLCGMCFILPGINCTSTLNRSHMQKNVYTHRISKELVRASARVCTTVNALSSRKEKLAIKIQVLLLVYFMTFSRSFIQRERERKRIIFGRKCNIRARCSLVHTHRYSKQDFRICTLFNNALR